MTGILGFPAPQCADMQQVEVPSAVEYIAQCMYKGSKRVYLTLNPGVKGKGSIFMRDASGEDVEGVFWELFDKLADIAIHLPDACIVEAQLYVENGVNKLALMDSHTIQSFMGVEGNRAAYLRAERTASMLGNTIGKNETISLCDAKMVIPTDQVLADLIGDCSVDSKVQGFYLRKSNSYHSADLRNEFFFLDVDDFLNKRFAEQEAV